MLTSPTPSPCSSFDAAATARRLAEIRAQMDGQMVNGYLVGDLRRSFERHQVPGDWKAPIDTTVEGSLALNELVTAIMYFTATEAKVERVDGGGARQPVYHVTSIGYRLGPAGP